MTESENHGIDVVGRKMKFNPWPTDSSGKYRAPSSIEVNSTYGISGEAVAETLGYFETCGGDVDALVLLLNDHAPSGYSITKAEIFETNRNYGNEYFFYCAQFTKKLTGRYDFHFGEGSNELLSNSHRIYERGFLEFLPYGEGNEDVSNDMVCTFYRYYIQKYPHLTEFLDWADILCLQKGMESYKETIFPLRDMWINNEFLQFLFEFAKVLINHNDLGEIIGACFNDFRFANLTFVPLSLLPGIVERMLKLSSNIYHIHVSIKRNVLSIEYSLKSDFDPRKMGIWANSVRENRHQTVLMSGSFALKNSLHLKIAPEYRLLTSVHDKTVRFELEIVNSLLWQRIGLGALAATIIPLLALSLDPTKNWILILALTIFAVVLSQIGPLLVIERRKSSLYIKHNDQNVTEKEEVIAELRILSEELLAEKLNLEEKVRSRTMEIKAAHEKLRELDKAKTEFFYNVNHELRTPLTLIKAPLEAIRNGNYGTSIPVKSPILDMALRNVNRLSEQVDMLLDFAKIDQKRMAPDWKEVDLRELCAFFASELIPRATVAGLRLTTAFPDEALVSLIDVKLFERLFFNLALNALKFTRSGGKVEIALRPESDTIILSIEDTGIGIPADKIDTIFERFVQVDSSSSRRYEGTGLGLALAKEVCLILQSEIKVKSEVGKGSTFSVILKRSQGKSVDLKELFDSTDQSQSFPEPSMMGNENESQSNADATILLVEDTADLRQFLSGFLRKKYRVLEAENGQEAWEIFQGNKKNISLIMTDIMMPLMDGRELHRRVVADEETVPFLFITARASLEEKVEAVSRGAVDYIYKPFSVEEVLNKAQSLVSLMKGQERRTKNEIESRLVQFINKGNLFDSDQKSGIAYDLSAYNLTGREHEVAVKVLEGKRNKEIADELSVSIHTISHHLEAIYKKTSVNSRLEFINAINKKP